VRQQLFLTAGAALMAALGVVRAAGGLALLLRGPALDPAIQASASAAALVGGVLLILGLLLLVAALGVFRHSRAFWMLGVVASIAFVVDGVVNGLVLYGRPGAGGTVANLIAALLILGALGFGRSALRGSGRA
jgi:hypothetical protein